MFIDIFLKKDLEIFITLQIILMLSYYTLSIGLPYYLLLENFLGEIIIIYILSSIYNNIYNILYILIFDFIKFFKVILFYYEQNCILYIRNISYFFIYFV